MHLFEVWKSSEVEGEGGGVEEIQKLFWKSWLKESQPWRIWKRKKTAALILLQVVETSEKRRKKTKIWIGVVLGRGTLWPRRRRRRGKGGGQEEEEEYRIISDVSEMWNDGYLISADVAGVACNGGERLGNSSLVHWFGGWHQDGSVGLVFDWFDLALWVNDYRAWALCDGCRNGQPDPPDSDWFLLLLLFFFSQRWNCCLVLLWYIFFWLHLLLFVLLPHLHLDVGLVQGPWQQSSTSMTIDYRCSDVGNCCSPQQPTQYS